MISISMYIPSLKYDLLGIKNYILSIKIEANNSMYISGIKISTPTILVYII